MPIRNMWSLEPGECVVAEEILSEVKGAEVYFPLHDVGVDLLVAKGRKHVAIQVKESRYFTRRFFKGSRGHSWHQLDKRKFTRDRRKVDLYIFVTYIPRFGEHRFSSFENRFVVVPAEELASRIARKRIIKGGKYAFYFHFEGSKVTEKRDEIQDYSDFLNNWKLIKDALSG